MRARLVALMAALLLFLSIASPAFATTPVAVTGSPQYDFSTFRVTSSRQADGNTFTDYTVQGVFTGAFSGTFTGSGTMIVHADGSLNTSESGSCDCTVSGRSGTLTYRVDGTGPTPGVAAGSLVGGGSGGLAGLHFQGTWQEMAGAITFSARLHFDPR